MLHSFSSLVRKYWLHGLVGLVLVVALLYGEEDWRGAHAWAETQAEWEAKGESFDRIKFIPPPVADDQNLAAISLFKLEPVMGANGMTYLSSVALREAMRSDPPPANEIPQLGKWNEGELTAMVKIRSAVKTNFSAIFPARNIPETSLEQFDSIYPFLSDLCTTSTTHSDFRLNMDYTIDPPSQRAFGPVVDLVRISKLLALHASLALDAHQGEVAIADLELNQKLLLGAQRDPSLIGGLVAMVMRAISNTTIFNGVANHAWNNSQLAEIEDLLKPVDFLSAYQFAMRSETVFFVGMLKYDRQPGRRPDPELAKSNKGFDEITAVIPTGWWLDNERQLATFDFEELAVVDPISRRVFPDVSLKLERQSDEAKARWDAFAPWNIFAVIEEPAMTQGSQKFAEAQVSVDETRIACALERYRLAHGVYPATLAELAPADIAEVPHDIMNGEPYHYRLKADGTFLLYSVGWNQTDDGGTVAHDKDNPKTIDYENGDWVWPTAKLQ